MSIIKNIEIIKILENKNKRLSCSQMKRIKIIQKKQRVIYFFFILK